MACQFSVFLGIPIFTWADLPSVVLSELESKYDPDDPVWDITQYARDKELRTDLFLTRENAKGEEVRLPVVLRIHVDLEMGFTLPPAPGVRLLYGTVFGVKVNSRYGPGFLDCDSPNGEGEFMAFDLEEVARHLEVVRKVPGMEKATLILIHEHF